MEPNCCEPLPHIFCEKCQVSLEEPCWTHATHFSDKHVVPYAVASLPEQLYLDVSGDEPDKTVCAKEFLPSHSVFGPLVAPLSESGAHLRYVIRSELDQKLRCFQLDSDLSSNWMKYVRFAHEPFEQNAAVYSVGAQIFFVTTVDIFPGEELKVGYSVKYYTKLMHISSTDNNPTENSDLTGSADPSAPDDPSSRNSDSAVLALDDRSLSGSNDDSFADHEFESHSDHSSQSGTLQMGLVTEIETADIHPGNDQLDVSSTWTKQRLRNRDEIRQSACPFPADIKKPKKPKEIRKRQRCRLCRGKYRFVNIEKHLNERHPEYVKKIVKKKNASASLTQKSTATCVEIGKDSAQTVTKYIPSDSFSLIGNANFQAQPIFTLVPTESHRNRKITPDEPDVQLTPDDPVLSSTDRGARGPSSPEPYTKTFVVNNWQISCFTPVPDLCEIACPNSAEGQKSPECRGKKRRRRPRSADYTENLPAQEMQFAQSVEKTQSPLSMERKEETPASLAAYTEALSGGKPQPCFLCSKMIIHMDEHIKRMHVELACSECNRDFSTAKDLLVHITEFHPVIVPLVQAQPQAQSAQEEAINFMMRTGFVHYRCSKCRRAYPSKALLDLHTGTTDVTRVPPQCPECEFIGTTFPDLIQHVSCHALGKRQRSACLLCDYRTRSLKRHLRIAHPAEMQMITEKWRFECLECQEKFLKKSFLYRHTDEVHKGDLCLCCGARVLGAAAFNEHVKEHIVDGAFLCRLCGRSCAEYRELHKHFGGEHREDVRVQCRLCQTVCRTAKSLAVHMKKRHNLDECGQNEAMVTDSGLPVSDMRIDAVGTLSETFQSSPNCVLIPVSVDEPGTDVNVSQNDGAMSEEEAGDSGSSLPTTTNKRKQARNSYKRKCQLCDGKFYDREKHMRDAHPDCQDPDPYACLHCTQTFSSEGYLRHHAKIQAHPLPVKAIAAAALQEAIEHIKTTGTFSYYCSKCRVRYPTKTLLLLHEFMHVTDGMEEQVQRDCPECGYTAPSFKELVSHIPQHAAKPHGRKQCFLCGDSFTSLKVHVRQGHSELMKRIGEDWEYDCKECGQKFKRKGDLEIHSKASHNGFRCWYCAKILYRAKEFGIHVQEHKVNDAYPCPSCGKIFPLYSRLNNHYRVNHDLTNARTCAVCQMVCLGSVKLARHMYNAHSSNENVRAKKKFDCKKGRGPDGRYHCEQCGEMCSSYNSLYRHKRWMHTGDYKEKFYQKKAEEKEKGIEPRSRTYVKPKHRLKLDEFPYQCMECQMGFVYEVNLIKHNETCHKGT